MTLTRTHRASLASLLLALACGPEGESTVAEDATSPPAASQAAVASALTPVPVPPPPAEPEPEPEPEPPNAEPAALRLALHGRCEGLGMSTVDGEVFVYHRSGFTAHIDRMDERGGVAQGLVFNEEIDVGYGILGGAFIRGVYGRWPDQIYVVAGFPSREYHYRHLYRLVDEGWKRVELLPDSADYQGVWPWYDRSILALASDDERNALPRLAVVRGEPKGPSLKAVQRKAKCSEWDFELRDLHPRDDGGLTALIQCKSTWLATWAPGEPEASAQKLGPTKTRAQLLLGDDGQGFIALDSGLMEWRNETLQPVALPQGGKLDEVDRGPGGEPWIRQGNVVSRWTPEGWQRAMELPEGPRVRAVLGLEVGTPWVRREGDALSMQTADGSWHDVPLSATPDLDKIPKIEAVHVVGPGDVWVTTKYWQMVKKHVGRERNALYTTRPVEMPRKCGNEPT